MNERRMATWLGFAFWKPFVAWAALAIGIGVFAVANSLVDSSGASVQLDTGVEIRRGDERTTSTEPSDSADERIDYTRDIRPILSDRCFSCHGPDAESREGGFRLDLKESAMGASDSGIIMVVPGKPADSELLLRISSDDAGDVMPPLDSGKRRLTSEEIGLIRRWIEQGADWKDHWSFEPLVRPERPTVGETGWPRNEIDFFTLAAMEKNKLSPSPPADNETLLRRVTFDLTGLPPTIEEMDSFLADDSPGAYERKVDQLLASDRYGEHMGRFWLDAARYGDTHGMHMDNYREMWPYRDWVVRAFNANKRYDEFMVEQLAGDLLPDPTLDQIIATGFVRSHVSTNEGGSIYDEVYVRNVVDRVVTTGTVFMGLTFECARCHDHKFDALTQKDFYSMFAFFNSLDGAEMDGNTNDSAPVVHVPTAEQANQLRSLTRQRNEMVERRGLHRRQHETEFLAWCREMEAAGENSNVALESVANRDYTARYSFESGDESVDSIGKPRSESGKLHGDVARVPGRIGGGIRLAGVGYVDLGLTFKIDHRSMATIGMWIKAPPRRSGALLSKTGQGGRGFSLHLEDGRLALYLTNRPQSYGIHVASLEPGLDDDQWHYVTATYDGSAKASGVALYVDGMLQRVEIKLDSVTAKESFQDFSADRSPIRLGEQKGDANLDGVIIDELRLCKRRLSRAEIAGMMTAELASHALSVPLAQRSDELIRHLRDYYFNQIDDRLIAMTNQIEQIDQDVRDIEDTVATTLVFRERAVPISAFVLERGEYDQKGDPVSRMTPGILPAMKPGMPRNRLGFAQWLVDREHPLTSRVTVNRIWGQLFGIGIVATAGDFGSQGDVPSHPLLLDWLSVELMESGWNIKALVKRMVMSRTYRQSSVATQGSLGRDPDNRLLARGPRFRLDAEMIRDQALSVSGLLDRRLGGPSVKPPQPPGLWKAVAMQSSNTNRFKADQRPDQIHRRTLYTFIKRTAPPPQMSTFDAPSRESCTVQRERTNTPLQALLLMNDPEYFKAARGLAHRTIVEGGPTIVDRVRFMLRLCTGKRPLPVAVKELDQYFKDQLAIYQANPNLVTKMFGSQETVDGGSIVGDRVDSRSELAAWCLVANLILNMDSVVTKN